MSLTTAVSTRGEHRLLRAALLFGAVVVAALAIGFVTYQVLAGGRPKLLLEVRSQTGAATAFDPVALSAPADAAIALSFTNGSTLDHNLVFLDPIGARTRAIVPPGESELVEFRTPAPGVYSFVCTIHEGMSGTLTVN